MMTVFHSNARSRELSAIDKPRAGSWISLVQPTEDELQHLAEEQKLDIDLLHDAIDIYEAPRIETDDGNVYIYTRYCYPDGKEVATEPLLIIYTPTQLITVMRSDSGVFAKLWSGFYEVITTQKTKTMMQILGEVNASYRQQLQKVSKRTLQIRAKMRQNELSRRDFVGMIELEEDLNEFLSALQPQAAVLNILLSGKYIRLYEDDKDIIEDLRLSASELIELTKSRLRALGNIRQAYDTIATADLNQTFKRLTSIAIFLTIPTTIGGLWGMNVAVPFAHDPLGFWLVVGIIVAILLGTIAVFHRRRWI